MTDMNPNSVNSAPSSVDMPKGGSRRQWLGLGVGVAAVAAGVAVGWRQMSVNQIQSPPTVDNLDEFWNLKLNTPSGQPMALRAFKGKPLLLNFWATWCPPCVEELPLLNRFYQENAAKSWQVLGLAIDKADAVQGFLRKTPLGFPVVLGGSDGMEIGRDLGNAQGSLPYSVVFDATGKPVHRKIGSFSAQELQGLVSSLA